MTKAPLAPAASALRSSAAQVARVLHAVDHEHERRAAEEELGRERGPLGEGDDPL